jgi:ParB/RepB/Spo0J family partition protein
MERLQRLHKLMDVALARPVEKLHEAQHKEAVMPDTMRAVPIDRVRPGTSLRHHFPENEIDKLAQSIREKGVLQRALVRPSGEAFELIAGERRWRAAQRAGLHEIPVIVREVTDHEAVEIALIENLQRESLSPIEEAEAYRRLIDMCGCSQQDIAKIIGKTESYVSQFDAAFEAAGAGAAPARGGRTLRSARPTSRRRPEPDRPRRRGCAARPECPPNRIACAEALSASPQAEPHAWFRNCCI